NKNAISGDVISTIINFTAAFVEEMRDHGVDIHLAGGETADVGDIVRTIDVGYTAFARMKRSDLIVNDIKPGDVIVGLASYGQSTYEKSYNGGMGSNGLTSARHDVFSHDYAAKYPESFDPSLPDQVVYIGSRKLTDEVAIGNGQTMTAGKLVLSPTRTYLPVIAKLLKQLKSAINGMIHNTGGGLSKVVKFVDGVRIVKDNLMPLPPLFQMIHDESGTDWQEMYQVFNMGQRLEVYLPKEEAQQVIDIAREFNIDAQIIGRVEKADAPSVRVESPYGTFEYDH
ncbi:MAG: hypothetical protein KI786_02805, partial [Mameliella sp.]|nr:hypothetical protein [Phaeodactylibacter sp.]